MSARTLLRAVHTRPFAVELGALFQLKFATVLWEWSGKYYNVCILWNIFSVRTFLSYNLHSIQSSIETMQFNEYQHRVMQASFVEHFHHGAYLPSSPTLSSHSFSMHPALFIWPFLDISYQWHPIIFRTTGFFPLPCVQRASMLNLCQYGIPFYMWLCVFTIFVSVLQLMDTWVVLVWGCDESCCSESLCTSFCVDFCSCFSLYVLRSRTIGWDDSSRLTLSEKFETIWKVDDRLALPAERLHVQISPHPPSTHYS